MDYTDSWPRNHAARNDFRHVFFGSDSYGQSSRVRPAIFALAPFTYAPWNAVERGYLFRARSCALAICATVTPA